MENTSYTIVFEKLSTAKENQSSDLEIMRASDEIAELRKIVLEVTQTEYKFITTT
jgi:hypothetical protein